MGSGHIYYLLSEVNDYDFKLMMSNGPKIGRKTMKGLRRKDF